MKVIICSHIDYMPTWLHWLYRTKTSLIRPLAARVIIFWAVWQTYFPYTAWHELFLQSQDQCSATRETKSDHFNLISKETRMKIIFELAYSLVKRFFYRNALPIVSKRNCCLRVACVRASDKVVRTETQPHRMKFTVFL